MSRYRVLALGLHISSAAEEIKGRPVMSVVHYHPLALSKQLKITFVEAVALKSTQSLVVQSLKQGEADSFSLTCKACRQTLGPPSL